MRRPLPPHVMSFPEGRNRLDPPKSSFEKMFSVCWVAARRPSVLVCVEIDELSCSLDGVGLESRTEFFHLDTLRVAESVPNIGLPVLDPIWGWVPCPARGGWGDLSWRMFTEPLRTTLEPWMSPNHIYIYVCISTRILIYVLFLICCC